MKNYVVLIVLGIFAAIVFLQDKPAHLRKTALTSLENARNLDDTLDLYGVTSLAEMQAVSLDGKVSRVKNLPIPAGRAVEAAGMVKVHENSISAIFGGDKIPYLCTYVYDITLDNGDKATCLTFIYGGAKLGYFALAISIFESEFTGTLPADAAILLTKLDAGDVHITGGGQFSPPTPSHTPAQREI